MTKFFTVSLVFLTITLFGQKFENLALTPPMGWNSWNCFQCDGISEKAIKEVADAMVSSGMAKAGYEYIVIDDCWQVGRDKDGYIIVDSEKFPSGIKHLADYIHSKGLKFGIYSDAGTHTCAGRPGSRGFEQQDARTYAAWGVDYLKYDWCNTKGQNQQDSYMLMRDALYRAGRPVVFSICEWGYSEPWKWASDVGHLWRTTLDIADRWDGNINGNQLGWVEILEKQVDLWKYAGPGHWNDPDMLEVGNSGLTTNEARAHFTMWCMLAAPLIAGNDLRKMSDESKAILTNSNLIAINQDSLGKQSFKILDYGNFEVWQKPLSGGDIVICLLNLENKDFDFHIDWQTLKIKGFSGVSKVKNLWTNEIIGTTESKMKLTVPLRDVVVFRLIKQ